MSLIINVCKYCKEIFLMEHGSFANHVRWCKHNNNYNHDQYVDNFKKGIEKRDERLHGVYKLFHVKCSNCYKEFEVIERGKQFPKKEKYFCNRSCANTRHHSTATKRKIGKSTSKTTKWLWENDEEYVKKQLERNKFYTSKGEREVRDYFKKNFPNDGWTFGGLLRFNNVPLVRDLYSNRLKVCIEYDGIWHFDNIKGQLIDKHLQDISLEKWCLKNSYRLVRIDEDLYYKNKEYWINKLIEAVYKDTTHIIKFWDDKNIKTLQENLNILNH